MDEQTGNGKGNSNPEIEKLELELGKVSYQLSQQAEVVQEAQKKFQAINKKGDELVTEIRKWLTKS